MKKATLILIVFFALATPAQGHLVKHYSKGMSDSLRVHRHKLNLAHVSYVCAHGSGNVKTIHCQAERWLKRLLAPPIPTTWWATVQPYDAMLDRIAMCESEGNWYISTGNSFYGGLQFDLGTWQSVGGTGYPNQASELEQKYRAVLLIQKRGYAPWPICGSG